MFHSGFCPCGTRLPLGPWDAARCPRCRAACVHALNWRLTDLECSQCGRTLTALAATVPALTFDDRRVAP